MHWKSRKVQGGLGDPMQVQGLLSISLTSVATLNGMTFSLLPLLAAAQISSLPTLLVFISNSNKIILEIP